MYFVVQAIERALLKLVYVDKSKGDHQAAGSQWPHVAYVCPTVFTVVFG